MVSIDILLVLDYRQPQLVSYFVNEVPTSYSNRLTPFLLKLGLITGDRVVDPLWVQIPKLTDSQDVQ